MRYDGQSKTVQNPTLDHWFAEGRLVTVCPEVNGGLPVPRPAAEFAGSAADILTARNKITTEDGDDVSRFFLAGAQQALSVCRQQHIRIAILKENSPSCGASQVYDGSFSKRLIPGAGITTTLLRQNGIRVFSEHEISKAAEYLCAY